MIDWNEIIGSKIVEGREIVMSNWNTCPYCGGEIRLQICDEEGNPKREGYEQDPWSGLGYLLIHTVEEQIGECPIATFEDEPLGTQIYESKEEAISVLSRRAK